MVSLSKLSIKTSMFRALYFRWRQWNGMFPIETTFVAHDNNEVLTVKLGHETSLVAYSTDKRSKPQQESIEVKPPVSGQTPFVTTFKRPLRLKVHLFLMWLWPWLSVCLEEVFTYRRCLLNYGSSTVLLNSFHLATLSNSIQRDNRVRGKSTIDNLTFAPRLI